MELTNEQREFLAKHAAEWRKVGAQCGDRTCTERVGSLTYWVQDGADYGTWISDETLTLYSNSDGLNLTDGPDIASPAVCGILAEWLRRNWCNDDAIRAFNVDTYATGTIVSLTALGYDAVIGDLQPLGQALLSALMWAYTAADSPVRDSK